jgi:hypothetical protein
MLPTPLPHLPLKLLLPQPLPPLLLQKVSSRGNFPYDASRSAGGVFVTNLSLDANIPSLADSFHSTALSGSTHLGQKIGDGFRYQTYSLARTFTTGKIRYRRWKLL